MSMGRGSMGLRLREGQEVAHHAVEPMDLVLHDLRDRKDSLARGVAFFDPSLEQRELQRRGVERVSHLVREARGHRADSRQSLRAQRAAQHLLFARDVDADEVGRDRAASVGRLRAMPFDLAGRAVLDRQTVRAPVATDEIAAGPAHHLGAAESGDLLQPAVPGRDAAARVQ